MDNVKIHSKRGIWYDTNTPDTVKRFDSQEAAVANVKGEDPVEPDDDDDFWEDDE